jgi:transposase-like protein
LHRACLRNVTSKLPERHHPEVKARWWKTFGEAASPTEARRDLEAIIADYRSAYPSAMAVIERDLEQLVVHLRWPTGRRKWIRSTDENVKRRSSRIGRVLARCIGCAGLSQARRSLSVASSSTSRRRSGRFRACRSVSAVRRRSPAGGLWALGFGQGVVDPGAKRRFWD